MAKILVIHDGSTSTVAAWIAKRLRDHGDLVIAVDASGECPHATGFDVIIVGSRVLFGHHSRSVTEYVTRYREAIRAVPSFFFSTGRSEGMFAPALFHEVGWIADHAAMFPAIVDVDTVDRFVDDLLRVVGAKAAIVGALPPRVEA